MSRPAGVLADFDAMSRPAAGVLADSGAMSRPADSPRATRAVLEAPLDAIAAGLEGTAWAAELVDPQWRLRWCSTQLKTTDGRHLGTIYIYGSSLPASLLAMVARGDPAMFERMARLVEPGRREAALLFADLQASGPLSRHLPSAAYFQLIRELTTAIDAEIGAGGGVVGKHAGDGVTAFLLADDLGGASAAATAAIRVARGMTGAARRIGDGVAGIEPGGGGVALNMGLHWGATLYMGQLSTGNRLEVTALGDEVNECARVEQCAHDGAVLATKALIERLDRRDAQAVGIDPVSAQYRALAEVPGASEKALRDAGSLAVCELGG